MNYYVVVFLIRPGPVGNIFTLSKFACHGVNSRVPKECGKRSSITFFFPFWSLFGHFSWCFCHLFRHFLPDSFCRTPLAAGWNRITIIHADPRGGKKFRKLLRRKHSSAKLAKISRNTLKSSKSDIFYLLRNLPKYLLRTFSSSAKFSEVFTLCVLNLWLSPMKRALFGRLSSLPPMPPPQKRKFCFYCRLAVSDLSRTSRHKNIF